MLHWQNPADFDTGTMFNLDLMAVQLAVSLGSSAVLPKAKLLARLHL